MNLLAQSRRPLCKILATGQTTQYSSELDDGYYKKGIAKSYTVLSSGSQSGNATINLIHLQSDTGAFVAATHTYTDAGKCGVFKAAGGETIIITGTVSNDGTYTSASATADVLVVTAGFANEVDAPMTTFTKQEVITNGNNIVVDNNTGLMWQRYCSTKLGGTGQGYFLWTGTSYDIFDFCIAANAAVLGGYSDWRVPNVYEAISIMDFEAATGLPDSTAWAGFSTYNTWTSTTLANDTSKAVYMSYSSGSPVNAAKTTIMKALLVRG